MIMDISRSGLSLLYVIHWMKYLFSLNTVLINGLEKRI